MTNKTNQRYIGIDLSKREMTVSFIEEGKKKIITRKYKTTAEGRLDFIDSLKKTDIIALETGNCSFILAYQILNIVNCDVYILNAGDLHVIFRSLKKTDKKDSIKIAKLIQRTPKEELPIVTLPTEEEMAMRSLVSERESINKSRTQSINKLHNLLWNQGITNLTRKDIANKKHRLECIDLLPDKYKNQAIRFSLQIDLFDSQLLEIEQEEKEYLQNHIEEVTISMSIPGIGSTTALAILAYMGNMNRFSKATQVCFYTGLVPKVDCSGDQVHYGNINRVGPKTLRKLLIQAAWSSIRGKSGEMMKLYYDRIKTQRGKGRAIVAVGRKIVQILFTLYKKGELYNTCEDDYKRTTKKLRRYNLISAKN